MSEQCGGKDGEALVPEGGGGAFGLGERGEKTEGGRAGAAHGGGSGADFAQGGEMERHGRAKAGNGRLKIVVKVGGVAGSAGA